MEFVALGNHSFKPEFQRLALRRKITLFLGFHDKMMLMFLLSTTKMAILFYPAVLYPQILVPKTQNLVPS